MTMKQTPGGYRVKITSGPNCYKKLKKHLRNMWINQETFKRWLIKAYKSTISKY